MLRVSRNVRVLLSTVGAAALLGSTHAATVGLVLVPVHPTAPADHATIETDGDPLDVRLVWNTPREPMPVRFFVEVVAIEAGGSREVFASYVDQSAVAVRLVSRNAEYAWRVYAVGRDVATYALSGWERFSVRAAQ
ncbi:MAG TPA: hypothetical protein VLI93_05405 [Acetobacteraceae bacterium]|nr:hypothetical protein [Acetobacteraceae bacterium]